MNELRRKWEYVRSLYDEFGAVELVTGAGGLIAFAAVSAFLARVF